MSTNAPIVLTGSWQQVAVGACSVRLLESVDGMDTADVATFTPVRVPDESMIQYHYGATPPAANTTAFDTARNGFSYGGTENVYARTETGNRVVVVVHEIT